MKKRISTMCIIAILISGTLFAMLFFSLGGEETALAQGNTNAYILNQDKEDFATFNELLARQAPLTWTFNGSSTTENGGQYSNNYRNYVEIIESRLRSEYGRESDRFVNLAVGGYTVNSFSYFEGGGASSFAPDIAYINIGKNDGAFFMSNDGYFHYKGDALGLSISKNNPNLKYFKKKVEQFVDEARSEGALVILAVPNSMTLTFGNVQQRIFYEEYFAPAIREIAEEKQVLLVDYLDHFVQNRQNADSSWFRDDGIHVNQLGYIEHAQTFFNDLGMYDADSLFSTHAFTDLKNKMPAPYFTPLQASSDIDFTPDFDEQEPLYEAIINRTITAPLDYTSSALDAANELNEDGEGSLVIRFRTSSTAASRRMLTFSAEDSSTSSVMLSAAYERNFHCLSNGNLWSIKELEVDDGAWHTAVVISGESGTQIYIDGDMHYYNSSNLFGFDSYTRVIIGGSSADDTNNFIGDISYFRIFKGELSAGQAIEISSENIQTSGEGLSAMELGSLIKTRPIAFMGGAVTIGAMKESIAERSFAQYLFRNAKKPNMQILGGEQPQDLCARVEPQSVVFFMAEVLDKDGNIVADSVDEYLQNIEAVLEELSSKDCYVILLTPYPVWTDTGLNDRVESYKDALLSSDFAEGEKIVALDLFEYFSDLAELNPSIIRNWTEKSGLPNYIGHFEIAKKLSDFCGLGVSSVTTVPGYTSQFTNASADSGKERDNLSAIVREDTTSKAVRLIDVSKILSSYPEAEFEFYIEMDGQSMEVFATDGIINQKHPFRGTYTFNALAKLGNKTVYFNPSVYVVTELGDITIGDGELPTELQPGKGKLAGWQIALIVIGGVLILALVGGLVFEKQLKELLVKLKKSGSKAKEQPKTEVEQDSIVQTLSGEPIEQEEAALDKKELANELESDKKEAVVSQVQAQKVSETVEIGQKITAEKQSIAPKAVEKKPAEKKPVPKQTAKQAVGQSAKPQEAKVTDTGQKEDAGKNKDII